MLHQIQLLKKYGLSLRGSRGQHLLVDENIQRKFVSLVEPKEGETIVEIGPGLGAITERLLESGARVIAIEEDERFVQILKGELSRDFKKLTVIKADILKIDLGKYAPRHSLLKVAGNIPYYITSELLLHLIRHHRVVDSAYLTVQREIADRIFAQPGTKAYGRLTLLVRYYAEVSRAFEISRNCFTPRPNVDSSVMELVFRKALPRSVDEPLLFELIKLGFSARRKNILNALADGLSSKMPKEGIKALLNQARIPDRARAEELMLKDFMRLTEVMRSHEAGALT